MMMSDVMRFFLPPIKSCQISSKKMENVVCFKLHPFQHPKPPKEIKEIKETRSKILWFCGVQRRWLLLSIPTGRGGCQMNVLIHVRDSKGFMVYHYVTFCVSLCHSMIHHINILHDVTKNHHIYIISIMIIHGVSVHWLLTLMEP